MQSDFIEIKEKQAKPWGFWATGALCSFMAIAVIGTWLAVFGLDYIVDFMTLAAIENASKFAVGYLVASPILIGLCILFSRLRKGFTFSEYVGFARTSKGQLCAWLCITAIVIVCIDVLEYRSGSSSEIAMLKSVSFMSLLVFSLIAIFLAPITEEIVFRGFAFKGLWHSVGPIWTVLLTGFIFSLVHRHRNFIAHALIFVVAILLGIARIRTRSLYVPIAMHMICNLIGISILWYLFAQQNGNI
jgi:uncharacterized protein